MATGLKKISLIVAATAKDGGIGVKGNLPWRLRGDMAFFKKTTTTAPEGMRNAVIMGRKTWESIPSKFKPLADRLNIIVSSTMRTDDLPSGVLLGRSLEHSIELAMQANTNGCNDIDRIFLIGGSTLYNSALQTPSIIDKIHFTRVYGAFECDVFFADPESDHRFDLVSKSEMQTEKGCEYEFCEYTP
ncbi:dihydrofolate reductase [Sphaeroforma arctica JP610]|uniref:dihydrofolate reductase n=1 Tax=Sphaeroforma arctica JP610 TaxID=667725 RepID=A0A0L0GEF3_9EUKA|nr:dihydrofolate reductase [Sphaeroforma arctica JP610]KNC87407.1 dihydrofolate reductase [Sphaeroforma arctica JP610]|eukprot:XP_014161309.1 dihydrofolate reductase [Sphaeroforma arctica JP610]